MAQVLMPHVAQKDDALTTIMKGLQIASSIYGLKTNMANLDELERKQKSADNLAAGKYDKNQQVELMQKYDVSRHAPSSGDMTGVMQISDAATGSPLYVSLKQKAATPIMRQIAGLKDGKQGTYVKDYSGGVPKEVDFIEMSPDQVLRTITGVKNGQAGTYIKDYGGETPTELDFIPGKQPVGKGGGEAGRVSHWQKLRDGTVVGLDRYGKEVTRMTDETTAPAKPEKPGAAFQKLPREAQREVDELARATGKQLLITNTIDKQLDNVVRLWGEGDKNQAAIAGDQMLKGLNSEFGPDALGAEEQKRLGGLLVPKYFPNPIRGEKFGIDIPGFIEQVQTKSNALKQAMKANRDRIEAIYNGGYNTAPDIQSRVIPEFGANRGQPTEPASPTPARAATPTPQYKVGDIKTMRDGSKARWDGTKFIEVQ